MYTQSNSPFANQFHVVQFPIQYQSNTFLYESYHLEAFIPGKTAELATARICKEDRGSITTIGHSSHCLSYLAPVIFLPPQFELLHNILEAQQR